jgi:hypothetical protein
MPFDFHDETLKVFSRKLRWWCRFREVMQMDFKVMIFAKVVHYLVILHIDLPNQSGGLMPIMH